MDCYFMGGNMRIGMDVSIQVCRDEGYMVMDYPVYAFRKEPQNTDCRFTKSIPEYAREEWFVGETILCVDQTLNYNELWEMYQDNLNGINSFIGGFHVWKENPTPDNLLILASDIDSWCGLET